MNIAVDPKFRGIGVGRTLMEAIFKVACEKNVDCLVLEVSTENERAIRFYKRNGFKIVRVIKNYYPWGEDAYLMVKEGLKC